MPVRGASARGTHAHSSTTEDASPAAASSTVKAAGPPAAPAAPTLAVAPTLAAVQAAPAAPTPAAAATAAAASTATQAAPAATPSRVSPRAARAGGEGGPAAGHAGAPGVRPVLSTEAVAAVAALGHKYPGWGFGSMPAGVLYQSLGQLKAGLHMLLQDGQWSNLAELIVRDAEQVEALEEMLLAPAPAPEEDDCGYEWDGPGDGQCWMAAGGSLPSTSPIQLPPADGDGAR